ncbi:MAG: type I methionyl aminopeptidase [Candidatus Moranbacteria bacterium]|jgi:methionyl aminopeptidase|nr:type I methionyl aminopeptidase [Candidatus Moranbacteria bacterium]
MTISIKNDNEIKLMRESGRRLAQVMVELEKAVHPGISTLILDKLAEELVLRKGGIPAFKGYGKETGNPFPATICASINDEVVHGIPSENVVLKEGDILKIDIGMKYQGFFSDMARSFGVGNIGEKEKRIIETVKNALSEGIKKIKNGGKLSEYSKAVQTYVEDNGYSVIRNLVGHGIGKKLHEDPQIPNYYNRRMGDLKLEVGMTLALEPMINEGGYETRLGDDGWVFKTKDGKLSAHWEDTILITEKGVEILTIL